MLDENIMELHRFKMNNTLFARYHEKPKLVFFFKYNFKFFFFFIIGKYLYLLKSSYNNKTYCFRNCVFHYRVTASCSKLFFALGDLIDRRFHSLYDNVDEA